MRRSVLAAMMVAVFAQNPTAEARTAFHYAPLENLERIDVAEIAAARRTIDVAAYVLTDRPVIEALIAAAHRGVAVRIYLDGEQSGRADMNIQHPFARLMKTPGVAIKAKNPDRPLMHLKSYCVDGRRLRSGSANLSASGLKDQDNDLIVSDDLDVCRGFRAAFEKAWTGPDAE